MEQNLPATNNDASHKARPNKKYSASEKGSLALEQVLFIGAIVAMSVGLYSFYEDLSKYFADFSPAPAPTGVGGSTASAQG